MDITTDKAIETLTFEGFKGFLENLYTGNITPDQIKQTWHQFRASQDALKVELKGWKKDQLSKYCSSWHTRSMNKAQLIESVIDWMMGEFCVSGSVSMFLGEEEWDVVERNLVEWTPDAITELVRKKEAAREARKKRVEAAVKAIKNPETLQEFDFFVEVKGLEALTDEQLPVYDALLTQAGRTRRQLERERKAAIRATKLDADLTLIESIHTKHQMPIWVIQLSERVDSAKFKELKIRARALDGYYSSFRGNGAVPGFTFRDKSKAEEFLSLERIDGKERLEARILTRRQKAVANILELACNLKSDAQERLSRDRLTNTCRRARIAEGCEADACRDFQLANTMNRIAKGIMGDSLPVVEICLLESAIESESLSFIKFAMVKLNSVEPVVKYLDRLYHKVEFQDLESLLSESKYNSIAARHKANPDLSYTERESDRHSSPQYSHIAYAEFPYPVLHTGTALRLIGIAEKKAGCKLAAARLLKSCHKANVSDWGVRFSTERQIEDLKTICQKLSRLNDYDVELLKEKLLKYDRMFRLDITRIEELRTALREYLEFRGAKKSVNLEVTLDRSLLGLKIPGYFPTSKAVSQDMLNEAELQPHHLCLEPGVGGKANLAQAIRDKVGNDNLDCCEINPTLREVAIKKGFKFVEHDFLDLDTEGVLYDRILANPPFENHQDYKHLLKMWECLKEGGRIVSIVGASTANWEAFKDWLVAVGGRIKKLPEGSFKDHKDVSQTTGTQAYMVIIDKPFYSVPVQSIQTVENQLCQAVQLSIFEKENPQGVQLSLF